MSTNGTYNSGRRVPPPRNRPPTSSLHTSTTPSNHSSMADYPSTASKHATRDPYVMRVMVMVDNATEPDLNDEEASRVHKSITDLLNGQTVPDMPNNVSNIPSGAAVSVAIRKRLKSVSDDAILNALVLLDELVRTIPYFYRYVANSKFFRRLWRFVVPDYKNQVKSFIPTFGKPKYQMRMHMTNPELSERVKILIRAWAEELSIMFHGRYEPHAGFLIERYKTKRSRVHFPEVPKVGTPWVCPIPSGPDRRRSARAAASSSSSNAELLSLGEVENTVKLFNALVENAVDVNDVKEDACTELAQRCQHISDNLTQLSMNMSKEEELARAISISELLQLALAKYTSLMKGKDASDLNDGHIETVSLQSDDDVEYNDKSSVDDEEISRTMRKMSVQSERTSSHNRRSAFNDGPSPGSRMESRHSVDDNERLHDRERESRRELDHELDYHRAQHRNVAWHRDRGHDGDVRYPHSRDRSRDRSRNQDRDREYSDEDSDDDEVNLGRNLGRSASLGARSLKKESSGKLERKSGARRSSGMNRREKSDGDERISKTKYMKRTKDKNDGDETTLIDVPDAEEGSDGEKKNDEEAEGGSFSIIAERYSSQKGSSQKASSSSKSKKKGLSKANTKSSRTREFSRPDSDIGNESGRVGSVDGAQPSGSNGMGGLSGMYLPGIPNMSMNPMMMMPSPYAMYQSVNPMSMPDAMGMYGAYSTVNPAMYFPSVRPGMFNPMMGDMTMGSFGNMSGMIGTSTNAMRMGGGVVPNGGGVADARDAQGSINESANQSWDGLGGSSSGINTAQVSSAQMGGSVPNILPNMAGGSGMMSPFPRIPPMYNVPPVSPHDPTRSAGGNGAMDVSNQSGQAGQLSAMGLSKEEVASRAAAYQSAMEEAATAYRMAATAYKTMQGHAAIAQQTSPSTGPVNYSDPKEISERQTHEDG